MRYIIRVTLLLIGVFIPYMFLLAMIVADGGEYFLSSEILFATFCIFGITDILWGWLEDTNENKDE